MSEPKPWDKKLRGLAVELEDLYAHDIEDRLHTALDGLFKKVHFCCLESVTLGDWQELRKEWEKFNG